MLLTSTYPTWYNVIPPFVPLYPSLYPSYPIRIKGLVVEVKFNLCKIFHTNNKFALHMHTSIISALILNTLNTAIH
jgi:hypothetical protein